MKTKMTRIKIAKLQDRILSQCEAWEEIQEDLSDILESARQALGELTKKSGNHAIVATLHWVTHRRPCKKDGGSDLLRLDPRTRLYMSLEWLDELLAEVG